jgi:hypothetical protein
MPEEQSQALESLKEFLEADMKTKAAQDRLFPNGMDLYDDESIFKYIERVLRALDDIEENFLKMIRAEKINPEYGLAFSTRIQNIRNAVNNFFYSYAKQGGSKILEFINKEISYMRPEFVQSVNKGFVGYYLFYGADVLEPKTINECVHYIHSLVINNDYLYKRIPTVESFKPDKNYVYSYRGIKTPIGDELFEQLQKEHIDSDIIDIINLENTILIMGRNLGHAAVIEVDTTDPNRVFVKYSIPKNTNPEKMSKVRGLKVNNELFGKGDFGTTIDTCVKDIIGLMKSIPTDADIKTPNFIQDEDSYPTR